MLQITVPTSELWDEENEVFIQTRAVTLNLEHSLLAISKWESIYKKPYLEQTQFTQEEDADYIKCMTITPNVDNDTYYAIVNNAECMSKIRKYIDDPATATFFNEKGKKTGHSSEKITSELIYYWLVVNNIPFECQKWHINRLFSLVRICNIKNQSPKQKKKSQLYSEYNRLNAQRRAMYNTKG